MPNFKISIFLTNGVTAQIIQNNDDPKVLFQNLEKQLQADKCQLSSNQENAILTIKNPRETVVGYLFDQV